MNRSMDPSTRPFTWPLRIAASALLLGGTITAGPAIGPAVAVPLPTPPAASLEPDDRLVGTGPDVPSEANPQPTSEAATSVQPTEVAPSGAASVRPSSNTTSDSDQRGTGEADGVERSADRGSVAERPAGGGNGRDPVGTGSSGLTVDPATGYYVHARTGFLIVPQSGQMLVPGSLADTGYRYSFISGRVLYAHPETAAASTSPSPTAAESESPSAGEASSASSARATPSAGSSASTTSGAPEVGQGGGETGGVAPSERVAQQSLAQPVLNVAVALGVAAVAVLYYVKMFRRPARKGRA